MMDAIVWKLINPSARRIEREWKAFEFNRRGDGARRFDGREVLQTGNALSETFQRNTQSPGAAWKRCQLLLSLLLGEATEEDCFKFEFCAFRLLAEFRSTSRNRSCLRRNYHAVLICQV